MYRYSMVRLTRGDIYREIAVSRNREIGVNKTANGGTNELKSINPPFHIQRSAVQYFLQYFPFPITFFLGE
jgi:hypothetical protein